MTTVTISFDEEQAKNIFTSWGEYNRLRDEIDSGDWRLRDLGSFIAWACKNAVQEIEEQDGER